MTTKETFQDFLNTVYKTIKPLPASLRSYKSKFNNNDLSESKQAILLHRHAYDSYEPIEFIKEGHVLRPSKWRIIDE